VAAIDYFTTGASVQTIKLIPTLQRRGHTLADPSEQRRMLKKLPFTPFSTTLAANNAHPLRATTRIDIVQINVGKRCNQTCSHCHVDAGPDRKEVMPRDVLEACLSLLERCEGATLDITGGAPEMHPDFDEIVRRARAMGRHVIDRCNLTITRLPNYAYLPAFLAEHAVEIIASLPATAPICTDSQRGDGVFEQSIAALQEFNALGYGHEGTGLRLNLITNPIGAALPGDQATLEAEWKHELDARYGIRFNQLYTLTNMPISRFLEHLADSGELEGYLETLVNAFNPATIDGLMCRNQISVGWDGQLYDCDFNQMLELNLPQTVFDLDPAVLAERTIRVGAHCYACTASSGST
jgi:radical SAM/Cys-rich protein